MPSAIARKPFYRLLLGLAVLCCAPLSLKAEEYTYESLYTHYSIVKSGSIVELRHLRKTGAWLESAVDLAHEEQLEAEEARVLTGGHDGAHRLREDHRATSWRFPRSRRDGSGARPRASRAGAE
jgi:hypothetical protein